MQKPVYVADGLSFLPPFLSREFTIRRSSARELLTELLVTELGDPTHKSPYLIVSAQPPWKIPVVDMWQLRSASDDLVIYQPYQSPVEGSKDTALRFLKLPNPYLPKSQTDDYSEDERPASRQPLQSLHNLGGYSVVFKPGSSPSFLIKSASSLPQVIELEEASVNSLAQFHTSSCMNGFLYIDREVSLMPHFMGKVLTRLGESSSRSTTLRHPIRY